MSSSSSASSTRLSIGGSIRGIPLSFGRYSLYDSVTYKVVQKAGVAHEPAEQARVASDEATDGTLHALLARLVRPTTTLPRRRDRRSRWRYGMCCQACH